MTKCNKELCNNTALARGLCSNHWKVWRKTNPPELGVKRESVRDIKSGKNWSWLTGVKYERNTK